MGGAESGEKGTWRNEEKTMHQFDMDDMSSVCVDIMTKSSNEVSNVKEDELCIVAVSYTSEHHKIVCDNNKEDENCRHFLLVVDSCGGASQHLHKCSDDEPVAWGSGFGDKVKLESLEDLVFFRDEYHLILGFVRLVVFWNPDVVYGWNIQKGSLNYIQMRAMMYGVDVYDLLVRQPSSNSVRTWKIPSSQIRFANNYSNNLEKIFSSCISLTSHKPPPAFNSDIKKVAYRKMVGRIILDIYRVSQIEFKYTSYTLNHVYHMIRGVIKPIATNKHLVHEFSRSESSRMWVFRYTVDRLSMCEKITDHIGLVRRTLEMSRVYGVLF